MKRKDISNCWSGVIKDFDDLNNEIKKLKAENEKLREALEILSKTGDRTRQDNKATFYDYLSTLQLEFDKRIEYARQTLKDLEGEK